MQLSDISREVQTFPTWEAEVASALVELHMTDNVHVEVDINEPRLLVESEILDAYRLYRGEDECINLKRRLEVADIHG
jgi:hypothetical protein